MDWQVFIQEVVEVCIIPLLGILTTYLVKFIKAKSEEIGTNIDNKLANKYIALLSETISDCVIATNQTYVEALKDQNLFDKEAQENAFKLTYNSVMNILTEDAKNYLSNAYGDLSEYITKKIEAEVNSNKVEE